MRSSAYSFTLSATSGNDQGLSPLDHASIMAIGENTTDWIRRNHSSAVLELRTSGVHNTPQNPELISAVMKSR